MSNHVLISVPHFHPPGSHSSAVLVILLTLLPAVLLVASGVYIEWSSRRMFGRQHRRWDRWWWF